MKTTRRLKIAVWMLVAVVLAMAAAWFGRAFLADRDLGTSRLLNGWNDERFSTFHRLYFEIEPGMSRDELTRVVDKIYPAHGPRTTPNVTDDGAGSLVLFMHPEGKREPNCEGIFIRFSDDRVVSKSYSMD